jgi:hypothetical protein
VDGQDKPGHDDAENMRIEGRWRRIQLPCGFGRR